MPEIKKVLAVHMGAAEIYSRLSTAKKSKVGAVLVRDARIISTGYNGTPIGWSNTCEDENGNTYPHVLHAESNALMFAAREGISTMGSTLVTTMSPCFECSKLIIQSGVRAVVYRDEYRDTDGLELLRKIGINVIPILDLLCNTGEYSGKN